MVTSLFPLGIIIDEAGEKEASNHHFFRWLDGLIPPAFSILVADAIPLTGHSGLGGDQNDGITCVDIYQNEAPQVIRKVCLHQTHLAQKASPPVS